MTDLICLPCCILAPHKICIEPASNKTKQNKKKKKKKKKQTNAVHLADKGVCLSGMLHY